MSNYLLLLEHSLRDDTVLDRLTALWNRGNARLSLLVPQRSVSSDEEISVAFDDGHDRSPDDRDEALAKWRLHDAIDTLQRAGIDRITDAGIGRADPVTAVEEALAHHPYDAVIVVTGRTGIAGWFHRDIASRLGRKLDIDVIHLRAAPLIKA